MCVLKLLLEFIPRSGDLKMGTLCSHMEMILMIIILQKIFAVGTFFEELNVCGSNIYLFILVDLYLF